MQNCLKERTLSQNSQMIATIQFPGRSYLFKTHSGNGKIKLSRRTCILQKHVITNSVKCLKEYAFYAASDTMQFTERKYFSRNKSTTTQWKCIFQNHVDRETMKMHFQEPRDNENVFSRDNDKKCTVKKHDDNDTIKIYFQETSRQWHNENAFPRNPLDTISRNTSTATQWSFLKEHKKHVESNIIKFSGTAGVF